MPRLNAQRVALDDPPPAPAPPASTPVAPPRPSAAQAASPPAAPLAAAYLRHRAWLTAVLALRFGREAAADIAQDTYLRVHAYAPAEPIRRPRSMLMRIALNLASNRHRKAGRERLTDPGDLDALPTARGDPERAAIFADMLLALPPKLRDVFYLAHVEGRTYGEIARRCGISVGGVEKRMRQAVALCRDYMAR